MKIAIRDDDTSFYTTPQELEEAFADLEGFPISLSVVPFAVSEHAGTKPYGDVVEHGKYAPIGDNKELVGYIKERISIGQFEIVQHGINHEYREKTDGMWVPETEFLEEYQLIEKIGAGREYLEEVFGQRIEVFAAPSNAVTSQCASALDKLSLHTNSLFSKYFTRKFSLEYLSCYVKCNLFKLVTRTRYGGVLNFKNHKEITTFEFISYEQAIDIYHKYKNYHFPIIFYTHYWDLFRDNEKKKQLTRFIKEAIADGSEPSFLSECFQ